MLKVFKACLVFATVFYLIGCATIVSGNNRKLYVTTNPSGATVKVNDRTRISPAEFLINSRDGGYLVKISKEGYEPLEVDVERKVNAWAICNIFFGPGMFVGFPVDFVSGNAWKFSPTKIEETLTPIQTPMQPDKK